MEESDRAAEEAEQMGVPESPVHERNSVIVLKAGLECQYVLASSMLNAKTGDCLSMLNGGVG